MTASVAVFTDRLSDSGCQYISIPTLASTSCNFDSGLCDGWQQSDSDVFDWTRKRGSTWSLNTGPDYDHTSGTGKRNITHFI